jgi:Cys-rich protein (TIGR01571 family)
MRAPNDPEILTDSYCDEGMGMCCYYCWCATCLAAETNAMLNGRDCNVCDCLCANWPIDTLYTRRYVRAKYGLALRLQRNPFSLASWTGTYWDDFWFPVINWGLAFLVPTAFCCCTGLLAANLPMNAGFPLWSNGCMYTQATWKEAQYRQLAAKPNAKALIQSYSATGLRGPTNGVYSTSFFSCCNDPITLLYVLLLPLCARASAGAMAQGRATDVCDVMLPPTVWQVRKHVQAKYGIENKDSHRMDCAKVVFCNVCTLVQDLRELMLRNSRLHYLPLDPSTGMVSSNFGGSSASSQSSLSAPVPPVMRAAVKGNSEKRTLIADADGSYGSLASPVSASKGL